MRSSESDHKFIPLALVGLALIATVLVLGACTARAPATPIPTTPDAVGTAQGEAASAAALAAAEVTKASARLTLTAAAVPAEPTQTTTSTPAPSPMATATPAPAPTTTLTPTPEIVELTVTGGTVNVRDGPGTAYARIGELRDGETRRVTGRNAGGDWWQFAFDGKPGWVSGDLVTIHGDPATVAIVLAAPPPAVRCFAPKLRFYVEHKGCCGEIVGEVRDRAGQPFSAAQVEVTVPDTSYRSLWPLSPAGDYSITALDGRNPYRVRLVGARISSGTFDFRYPYQRERAVIDFFESACGQ